MENENNETLTIEGLKESLGLSTSEPEPTAATEPPSTDPAPDANNTDNGTVDTSKTEEGSETTAAATESQSDKPAQKPEEVPLVQVDKQAHAFAEMRKTIQEQNKVLADLGKALGIEGKPEDILNGLKKVTTAQQARTAGVPPEIMERLNALEAEKKERQANDRKIQVYASINNFQRNMGIDKQELDSFLVKLAQAGKNPFETDVDLRAEYLVMNFDVLQKKAVQEALEKQAALDQKAATHGTTPSKQVGGGEVHTTEVKTLDQLDAFLKANVK